MKLSPEKAAERLAMRRAGHTIREIAARQGCSKSAIWKWLKRTLEPAPPVPPDAPITLEAKRYPYAVQYTTPRGQTRGCGHKHDGLDTARACARRIAGQPRAVAVQIVTWRRPTPAEVPDAL